MYLHNRKTRRTFAPQKVILAKANKTMTNLMANNNWWWRRFAQNGGSLSVCL